MSDNNLLPLLWFLAILALIPALLWLLKRTPMGGAAAQGQMRTVAMLQIAPNQRLLTVEVGQGEDRRWLVLGVTAQQINTLHVMPPQPENPAGAAQLPPFAQLLKNRLRKDGGGDAS
jgi:flagellar protein FliO/FliZ